VNPAGVWTSASETTLQLGCTGHDNVDRGLVQKGGGTEREVVAVPAQVRFGQPVQLRIERSEQSIASRRVAGIGTGDEAHERVGRGHLHFCLLPSAFCLLPFAFCLPPTPPPPPCR
jgi:hypothetical protein